MKKKELLEHLMDAVRMEEHVTTVYLGHLRALSKQVTTKQKIFEKMKRDIEVLIGFNIKHRAICEEMYETVSKDERDDY